jgi:D-alanine-D-alanine ligase
VARTVVAVLFGGRSCEHEVSILTAHEAIAVLKAMPAYEVVPIYVTKDGRWLTGEALERLSEFAQLGTLEKACRPLVMSPMSKHPIAVETGGWSRGTTPLAIDVALPLFHGPNGEDGTLQGMLEMLGVPYAGSGVLASALCMDKIAMKRAFAAAHLPQLPYVGISRARWEADSAGELERVSQMCDGPLFVKPARGGSSIGVNSVESVAESSPAIELAFRFDDEVVVEAALVGSLEVNCAVLRAGGTLTTSVLEAIRPAEGFLTYDQKYLQWSKGSPSKGTGDHEIPARLPEGLAERIRTLAMAAFETCTCEGMARVDFLVRGEEVFVSEVNTLPGSLAFYLWEAAGITSDDLLDRLLKSAMDKASARGALTFSLDRNLLADIEERKGSKLK